MTKNDPNGHFRLDNIYSLQTWTIQNHFTRSNVAAELRHVDEMGYTSVEISQRAGHGIAEFINIVKGEGLRCSGIHLPCLMHLSSKQIEQSMAPYRDAIVRNGVSRPLLSFIGHPDLIPPDGALFEGRLLNNYRRYFELISTATRQLVDLGAVFAYHAYDFDLAIASKVLPELKDIGVGLALDTFYVYRAAKIQTSAVRRWADLDDSLLNNCVSFHLNDYDQKGRHVSLGSGCAPLREALALAGQAGASLHSLVVEHTPADGSSGLELSKGSADFVRGGALLEEYFRNRRSAGW